MCVFDPCSQLHNSHVGALYVCRCTVVCVPYLQDDFIGLQYLPNCLIRMFLQWTLQQMLWSFSCALAMTAGNEVQATTAVAKFSALMKTNKT